MKPHHFRVPHRRASAAMFPEGEEPTNQPDHRTTTVDLDRNVLESCMFLIMNYWRSYGRNPEALILGWRAYLTLSAQTNSDSPEVQGVKALVHSHGHSHGVAVLPPSNVNKLLEFLVESDHPDVDGLGGNR